MERISDLPKTPAIARPLGGYRHGIDGNSLRNPYFATTRYTPTYSSRRNEHNYTIRGGLRANR